MFLITVSDSAVYSAVKMLPMSCLIAVCSALLAFCHISSNKAQSFRKCLLSSITRSSSHMGSAARSSRSSLFSWQHVGHVLKGLGVFS